MVLYRRTGEDIDQGLVGYWPLNDLRRVQTDGIFAHFKFDDNAASTVVIDSKFGNNGVASANTSTLTGVGLIGSGTSLDFSGSTKIDLAQTIDQLGNTFSVSMWLNIDTSDLNFRSILVGDWQAPGAFTMFYYDGNLTFQCRDSDNTLLTVTNPASTATLYHVVVTADGTNLRMYIDGVLESTSGSYSGKNICYLTGAIDVGGTTSDFDGRLDDLRFYDRALSQTNIDSLYNSGSGVEATEVFRETVVARDLASFNDGTITGCTTTEGVNGLSPDAMTFDGVDDYIEADEYAEFDETASYAVSFWVNLNELGRYQQLIQNGVVGSARWGVGLNATNHITYGYYTGTVYVHGASSNNTISSNEWIHVGVNNTATTGEIYINGVKQSGTSTPFTGTSLTWRIGNKNNDAFFNGKIQNVRLYNRNLSSGEFKKLYRLKK